MAQGRSEVRRIKTTDDGGNQVMVIEIPLTIDTQLELDVLSS
jgi:hypothetical protein